MKAKVENLINKDRVQLQDVIPLETPYALAIDPCNLCNFRCEFCAIQSLDRELGFKKQVMPFELYKKIIDDLKEFPEPLRVLRLNGQGEPLLNKYFCEMVTYAKQANIANWIETITNGSILNPEFNQRLIDSGINRIRISVESITEDGYLNIAKAKISLKDFVENVKDLYLRCGDKCEVYIKIVDIAVPTEKEKEIFFNMFGDICHQIFIDRVIPLWSDFEELDEKYDFSDQKGVHGQKIQEVKICPYPFYSLIINADGEVTACCADWLRKLVLGDLKTESMKQIWNGEKLRNFWVENLKGNKNKFEMCRKCLLPMFDCNDNIDQFGDKILTKLIIKEEQ